MRTAPAVALALAALTLGPAAPARADELTAAKKAAIKKLMEITGSASLAERMASATSQAMIKALQGASPDIPPRAFEVVDAELRGLFKEKLGEPGQFLDLIVPIYHQHFTGEEIDQLVRFYESPIGKKVVATLPSVLEESLVAGQRWGESLAPEIQKRVMAALKREKLIPEDAQ